MSDQPTLRPETLAAQAGEWSDPSNTGVAPAIYPSTSYLRGPDATDPVPPFYTRDHNPTYLQAEALLARLEGGEECRLFGSGMSAAVAIFSTLAPGDHVILPIAVYHGVRTWVTQYCMKYGIYVDFVPNGDVEFLEKAARPEVTKLIWIETPANPTLDTTDIATSAGLAQFLGAKMVVDNTAATPVLTRPIELGANFVIHSATKYLNGHGDVLAGAIVTAKKDDPLWAQICAARRDGGFVLGPFEAWLLTRGMRTLYPRVRAQSAAALAIAEHIEQNGKVSQVLYPGLRSDPGHEMAANQMHGGFGAVISMRIAGGLDAALAVANGTKLFKRATSFGGVESLIEHRASVEPEGAPIPSDLLRISVGLEAPEDLVADLEQALAKV
jgi:cystathionine gamma-synthase